MNTPSLVRQKAASEKVCEFKTAGGMLYFPREDNNGVMHVVSSTGEIFQFTDSTSEQIFALNGQPNCLCFDNSNYMYIADLGLKTILLKPPNLSDGSHLQETVIAKEFEGKPFKGPTSLAYNREENCIYFSDSGLFDESSIEPFDNALYSFDLETRVLKRLLTGLSFISDICYDGNNACLYIAETFMNRIVRLKQNEDGIFHSSSFYQFNGRIGPTALTVDEKGNLFVARFEYVSADNDEVDADGIISVINKEGILVGELIVPKTPEISGLYISIKKKENLFFTLRNMAGVFKIKISSFSSEIDKFEHALKQL